MSYVGAVPVDTVGESESRILIDACLARLKHEVGVASLNTIDVLLGNARKLDLGAIARATIEEEDGSTTEVSVAELAEEDEDEDEDAQLRFVAGSSAEFPTAEAIVQLVTDAHLGQPATPIFGQEDIETLTAPTARVPSQILENEDAETLTVPLRSSAPPSSSPSTNPMPMHLGAITIPPPPRVPTITPPAAPSSPFPSALGVNETAGRPKFLPPPRSFMRRLGWPVFLCGFLGGTFGGVAVLKSPVGNRPMVHRVVKAVSGPAHAISIAAKTRLAHR